MSDPRTTGDDLQSEMWTLSQDRKTIRMNLPELPLTGLSKPVPGQLLHQGYRMNSSLRGKRILIVEDEFVTGELVRSCVEREAGIPIGPASTGQSAIDLLSRECPHAALLDVSLLDGSSVRVARQLETCGVPYAVLTGHAADSLPIELKAAPYLEKPVGPALLIATLTRLAS